MQSDPPQRPGVSCPGPGWGLAFTPAWRSGYWATPAGAAHALTRPEWEKGPRCPAWRVPQRASRSHHHLPPPAPIPATRPNPARGNWVGREATDGRRLQRDYAPVSCNLSKWTGQAGPLRAGVKEASAPTPARPGAAGEPGRALNGAGWRQGSGRRGSGLETGMGSSSVCPPTATRTPHAKPRTAPPLCGHAGATHITQAGPGHNHRRLRAHPSLTPAPMPVPLPPHRTPSSHPGRSRRPTPSRTG